MNKESESALLDSLFHYLGLVVCVAREDLCKNCYTPPTPPSQATNSNPQTLVFLQSVVKYDKVAKRQGYNKAMMQSSDTSSISHACIFYEQSDQLWNLCQQILEQAFDDNFSWLYISDEHSREAVLQALGSTGQVVDAVTLNFLEATTTIDRIISQLQRQTEISVTQGAKGLLLFVEMSWVLRTASGPAYLGEYETALHQLQSQLPLRVICLYNQRIQPESLMTVGLRTHPHIIASDAIHPNPHFLPPAIYLSGNRQAQLQHWLHAISPTLAPLPDITSLSDPSNVTANNTQSPTKVPDKNQIYSLESLTPLTTEQTDQQRWKIHCLGRLRVYRQDGSAVKWNVVSGATHKTKTLFSYLLHRGQEGATLEEIATLLWPNAISTEASLNRLYHTVHCLRMALSPELKSSRHSSFVLQHDQRYFLALPKGSWIDIPVFEQLCYKGDRLGKEGDDERALIDCLAAEKLYSGDLLEDIPVEYATNIEQDWCWSRRYWLREMYIKLLGLIAGNYRRLGNFQHALSYAERALRIDSYSDLAHQEMMQIFHATGRTDALQRQYRLYCQAIERFDGGAPSPITQQLYERLIETV